MTETTRRPSDRIRKLMALAEDQQGTPEGEAAARMARRLMFSQAKEQASRRYRGLPDPDPLQRHRFDLGGPDRWRRRLLASVARHVGCLAAWPRGADHAFVFGHRSAVEVAEYLYVLLSRELTQASTRWLRQHAPVQSLAEAQDDPDEIKRRAGFCHSAVTAVDTRLHALRGSEDGADPTGTALVLDRRGAVEAWVKAQGVSLSPPAERPWRHSQEGYLAGYHIPLLDAVSAATGPPA